MSDVGRKCPPAALGAGIVGGTTAQGLLGDSADPAQWTALWLGVSLGGTLLLLLLLCGCYHRRRCFAKHGGFASLLFGRDSALFRASAVWHDRVRLETRGRAESDRARWPRQGPPDRPAAAAPPPPERKVGYAHNYGDGAAGALHLADVRLEQKAPPPVVPPLRLPV